MSISPVEDILAEPEFPPDGPKPIRKKGRRRSTSHLKAVPETLEERTRIKEAAEEFTRTLDRSRAFSKGELENQTRVLMDRLGLPEKYLGFTMVMIGNFFWKMQFLAIPFERRMLLLPHCLKHAEGCPAEYTEFGLDCERCGACSIADYKVRAEQLGYKVLVAEGSPVVLKIIVSGYIDGILGVACLNVLEKAIDKILIAGVPSYAVPLHSGDCMNTTLDQAWVWDVLEKYEPLPARVTASYVPMMRASNQIFEDNYQRLLPPNRTRDSQRADHPVAFTEKAAYDWLAEGGRRFRPFITLAAWYAASNDKPLTAGDDTPEVPDDVARVAMAIEAFHKASLVHDDIQDDDAWRYGRKTLHREYGASQAINIGDYLIGLGYRLIHSARHIDPEIAADVLDSMSTAHLRLCDGQGAEMAWQQSPDWSLTPLDAMQIYALKTSPAFEAALYAGLRLAGHKLANSDMVSLFCRHLGVGFQTLNDLKDWRGDADNKLVAGQDALARRPTILLALALSNASDAQRLQLEKLYADDSAADPPEERVAHLREIFELCNVFDKAETLVERCSERALTLIEQVDRQPLRDLLHFFLETVLAADSGPSPAEHLDPSEPVFANLQPPPAPVIQLGIPQG
ncbi:MAG: polyprenyl synthetase family protein [Fuerstiella sp.]|nr:polyprenyl synthetase family protein [Fuerstiella sp.]